MRVKLVEGGTFFSVPSFEENDKIKILLFRQTKILVV